MARNPNTPADVLRELARDREWHVRRDVATNAASPRDVLAGLGGDGDTRVRRAAEAALRDRGAR